MAWSAVTTWYAFLSLRLLEITLRTRIHATQLHLVHCKELTQITQASLAICRAVVGSVMSMSYHEHLLMIPPWKEIGSLNCHPHVRLLTMTIDLVQAKSCDQCDALFPYIKDPVDPLSIVPTARNHKDQDNAQQ